MENNNVLPQIIGITGRKFNGKDTLGDFFVTKYGYKRVAFADALKNACKEIFGLSDDQLYGDKKEEIDEYWKTSPRTIFQFVGTDLFRNQLKIIMPNIGDNIWLRVIEKKISDEIKKDPSVKIIVTDVRFSNECQMVKDFGGIVIRVKRDMINNNDAHPSELEIDKLNVTFEVPNNETKEKLYENTIQLLLQNIPQSIAQ